MSRLIIKIDGTEIDGGYFVTRTGAILAALLAEIADFRVEAV